MVWVKCHGQFKNLHTHHTKSGRKYVMVRKSGGGTRRKYIHKKR
jgi:hypothetical protein